jgi:hypothetical protein
LLGQFSQGTLDGLSILVLIQFQCFISDIEIVENVFGSNTERTVAFTKDLYNYF